MWSKIKDRLYHVWLGFVAVCLVVVLILIGIEAYMALDVVLIARVALVSVVTVAFFFYIGQAVDYGLTKVFQKWGK